jgi:hypothetical protein
MPMPTLDPSHRTLAGVPPLDGYRPRQRVWVYSSGSWQPGVVLHASQHAVTVRYRPAEGRGTWVDTVTCHKLATRDDSDPYIDLASVNGPLTSPAPDTGIHESWVVPLAPRGIL